LRGGAEFIRGESFFEKAATQYKKTFPLPSQNF
jgi:hypothetical protein